MPLKETVKRSQVQGVRILGQPEIYASYAGASVDAFGRLRTSGPQNRFDVEFINDKQPLLVDEVTVTGGTATHSANSRDVTLAINNTTNATEAALYSHIDVPYTPGNGQLIEITGTLDNGAVTGGTASVFLRSSVTGSVQETVVTQTNWNNPVSDVDWSKSQIFGIDFQSLKVGLIRFFMSRNGQTVFVHELKHDNSVAYGYWQRPSLPVYWRIYNVDGNTVAEIGYGDTANGVGFRYTISANAGAELRAICATVKSEGGLAVQDMPGTPIAIDNGTTAVTVATTLIPLLSIRPAATINSIENRGVYLPISYNISGNNPIRYVVLYRPSLTGPSWTAVNATYSGMEYDVSASAVSGGIPVDAGYLSAGINSRESVKGLLGRITLALGRTGTSDILTIAAIRTGSTSSTTFAAMQWKEIR